MNSITELNIKKALLRNLYEHGYMSEDAYNHSLHNLPETLDYGERLGDDVVQKEVTPNGCLQSP